MNDIVEEREARRPLAPLAGEPSPMSRVGVEGAMADGRRRRRTRWWATGSVVAASTGWPGPATTA